MFATNTLQWVMEKQVDGEVHYFNHNTNEYTPDIMKATLFKHDSNDVEDGVLYMLIYVMSDGMRYRKRNEMTAGEIARGNILVEGDV